MKWFKITFSLGNIIATTKCSFIYLFLLTIGLTTMSFTNASNNGAGTKSASFDEFRIQTAAVVVQLNPQAVSFVQEYIRKREKDLLKMKDWGKPYFDLYDQILTNYDIPREMKYLSVIESGLEPELVSWAGAAGPWQIMPDEARRLGLRVGKHDERMDFKKSTEAAAQLLKELYGVFGDWLLVVAAYNGGVHRVKEAIRESGSKNFWELQQCLPEETRNHVKKFIGTHYIFEGGGGWTTLTAGEAQARKALVNSIEVPFTGEEIDHSLLVEIKGWYSASVITDELGIDIDKFYKWNPGFEKILGEGKIYSMRLMKDKAAQFEIKRDFLRMASLKARERNNIVAG
jgi:membrane-bound lytic murein transglycosylase D